MFTQPSSCRVSGWAENVAEHRREHWGWERELDVDCCVNIAPSEASRAVFGQAQTLPARSLRPIRSYFVFLPLGISPQPIAKGRERHWDADALWPQPVVQLENPYFLPAISHFPGQLLGGKGRDTWISPGEFSLLCTMPPCSFMESEKLRFDIYSCLGRLYSFPFSTFSRIIKSGHKEFGQCCVPSLPHTPVPCV